MEKNNPSQASNKNQKAWTFKFSSPLNLQIEI